MFSVNRSFSQHSLFKYLPAVLMMLAIFLFSAGQALDMPSSLLRLILNKGGHVAGYGVLALTYWRMFDFTGSKRWLAWLLAVLYAMTDEFHQSFVPGRYPSLLDVLVFDNLGALVSLWLAGLVLKHKQPETQSLAAEKDTLGAPG